MERINFPYYSGFLLPQFHSFVLKGDRSHGRDLVQPAASDLRKLSTIKLPPVSLNRPTTLGDLQTPPRSPARSRSCVNGGIQKIGKTPTAHLISYVVLSIAVFVLNRKVSKVTGYS